MKRKIAAGLAVFLCIGAAGVYAANPNGIFNGYPKVEIKVNGKALSFPDVPAFVISSKTVMPVKEAAEALNGMVEWDAETNTANIIKPNVHILLSESIEKQKDGRYSITPFSGVHRGSTIGFTIYSEIDNLPKAKYKFKVVVESPNGMEIHTSEEATNYINNSLDTTFINITPIKYLTFYEKGTYKIKLLMKKDGSSSEFVTVGEKTITPIEKK